MIKDCRRYTISHSLRSNIQTLAFIPNEYILEADRPVTVNSRGESEINVVYFWHGNDRVPGETFFGEGGGVAPEGLDCVCAGGTGGVRAEGEGGVGGGPLFGKPLLVEGGFV